MSQRHYLLIKTVLRCLRGILTAIEEWIENSRKGLPADSLLVNLERLFNGILTAIRQWTEEGRKELPSSSTLKLKR